MVSALIAARADLEARDQYGATPLNWAAGYGCAECVTLLLKAGASVTARNLKGATPLHVAGPKIAPLLIAAGADINVADSNGNKPLHRQFHSAFLPVGVNVRNNQGFTPLHFAALEGNEEAVRWLLSQGADPSAASTAPYEYREGLGPARIRDEQADGTPAAHPPSPSPMSGQYQATTSDSSTKFRTLSANPIDNTSFAEK